MSSEGPTAWLVQGGPQRTGRKIFENIRPLRYFLYMKCLVLMVFLALTGGAVVNGQQGDHVNLAAAFAF